MKIAFKISVVVFLIFVLDSCKKDKPSLPEISTTSITEISYTSAISGGNVINNGGAAIVSRGVCWSTSADPSVTDFKSIESGELGAFVSNISLLSPNTLYYVRAYATNIAGTAYGNQVSFTTNQVSVPLLSTSIVTEITQTTAVSGGNISDDKGETVTNRGICWSINQNPTLSDSKTSAGSGTGIFSCSIIGLTPGTTYYVRAYATNNIGTNYGEMVSFTTLSSPTLTTETITDITNTTATSGGNVVASGGSPVTSRGVCWGTDHAPTILDRKTSDGSGMGIFTSSITGLTLGTTYYVRAYATNSTGTSYGNEISFTTVVSIPKLTTSDISSISLSSAKSGGFISNDGGSNVTTRGVCWSTTTNPTIELTSKTIDGTGTGSFISSINGLTENTTYYLRAYATNENGTAYGNVITFNTQSSTLNFNTNLTYGTVTDIDGNTYKTITIGAQIWMAENLKTTKYRNGDLIGTTIPSTLPMSETTIAKFQWPAGGDETNVSAYGRLYTWDAVIESRNLCPTGWHVPTDGEWLSLANYLGGEDIAGGKLKEIGFSHWNSPNTGATNATGFTSVPNGYRTPSGSFADIGQSGHHWSSTVSGPNYGMDWYMYYNTSRAVRSGNPRAYGFAVRCVKD